MPKCMMEGCNAATTLVRGNAAANGWVVFDLNGPNGNRYGNACPDHKMSEVRKRFLELFDQIVIKDPKDKG